MEWDDDHCTWEPWEKLSQVADLVEKFEALERRRLTLREEK